MAASSFERWKRNLLLVVLLLVRLVMDCVCSNIQRTLELFIAFPGRWIGSFLSFLSLGPCVCVCVRTYYIYPLCIDEFMHVLTSLVAAPPQYKDKRTEI